MAKVTKNKVLQYRIEVKSETPNKKDGVYYAKALTKRKALRKIQEELNLLNVLRTIEYSISKA